MLSIAIINLIFLTTTLAQSFLYDKESFVIGSKGNADIRSLNYPDTAPPNLRQTISIQSENSNNNIKIVCRDFRIYDRKPCPDELSFRITDGDVVEKICKSETNYEYISKTSQLSITFGTDIHGGGFIDCTAISTGETVVETTTEYWRPLNIPRDYLKLESEEINTREHGVTPGDRNTTCPCGWTNKANTRIVNGVETDINEYPFMVSIRSRNAESGAFCGGSIITEYHVITAAHCTGSNSNNDLSVGYGEHDTYSSVERENRKFVNVKQVINHEKYNKIATYLLYDISLLVLEEKIHFSKLVGPICLSTKQLDLAGKYIKAIGWGMTSDGKLLPDGSYPENLSTLQKVNLRVLPLETCRIDFRFWVDFYNPHQLCIFSKNRSTCQGDSGGPGVWLNSETNRYTLVGLPSFSWKCGGKKYPSVMTDVTYFYDWIRYKIIESYPHLSVCTAT